jgi:hypothetical protein
MDVCEPRVRRRGFFLHSSDGNEPDTGEHENPEGFAVRARFANATTTPRKMASSRGAARSGRSDRSERDLTEGMPAIRSGSVTGSRQRSHLPR